MDIPGLLLALDRYPYGCAEQTTSRALPLLYMSSLAEKSGLAGPKGAKKRINKAITRLMGMQSSNGTFGLWSTYGGDIWLTAYVTDFLTRAKAEGYNVPNRGLEQALDKLQNTVNFASDFKSGGEGLAYALYVLARNGRASIGDLRYFVDAKLANFSTALAQAQLGAALSMYGDNERADQAYLAAMKTLNGEENKSNYRRDYGSRLRDGAAALTLISENKTSTNRMVQFSDILNKVRSLKEYTSTQENAWLLLAANALQNDNNKLQLTIGDKPHSGSFQKVFKTTEFSDKNIVITNKTSEEVTTSITVTGDAILPEPPKFNGFKIEREFYSLQGKKLDIKDLKQSERFVVVVNMEEMEAKRGRLILVDRIPAGFEIENPKLVTGSSLKALPWLKYNSKIEHSEFKDDKFVAAFDMSRGYRKDNPAKLSVAYIVRAVSPGNYLHPAATIEDMYRPGRFARTRTSRVTISK